MSTRCRLVQPLMALALCLVLATGLAQPLDEGQLSAAEIREETDFLRKIGSVLAAAHAYRTQESERLAALLAVEERTLSADDVHPDMLRAALLARDSMRSRGAVLAGQIVHRQAVLAEVQQRISTLGRGLEDAAEDDSEAQSRRADRDLLVEQAQVLHTLIDGLRQLLTASRRVETLSTQRLRLLQGRMGLDAVTQTTGSARDPRVAPLERVIAGLADESASLATQAGAIGGKDPDALARRDRLDMRLHDTGTRTFLRENDLDLIGLSSQLDGLVALREDSATPAHLLVDAGTVLKLLGDELQSLRIELADERRVLAVRRALLRGRGLTDGPAWAMTAELEGQIDAQGQMVAALIERIAPEPARFAEQLAVIDAAVLTERLPLPGARGDWQRIGAGIAVLPALVVRRQSALVLDLRERIADFSADDWVPLAGGGMVLIVGILGLVWWLGRPGRALGRRLAEPVAALVPVLPWTIPPLLWAWLGATLDLPTNEWLPGLLLLGVGPTCAFLLALVRTELFAPGLPAESAAVRGAFYRRLRWGLVLAAVVSTVYALTHSLPISPLVADLLDRLAMVGLLLLAVPAFGLKTLILGQLQPSGASGALTTDPSGEQDSKQMRPNPGAPRRHGARLLAWLSQAAALVLAAAGVLGFLGYLNLAWAIVIDLGWLALVAALLHLARAVLDDLYDAAAHCLACMVADVGTARGDLWQRQFLDPAHGFAVLLAWLVALWGLVRLWSAPGGASGAGGRHRDPERP
ncbi:hypothetical protein [uncultured Lamprocystis sp.]|uniref:hypothetical protein n=1 Tax=uncultured Lamprocystis sp. TaxID=543132 RepID=UPI0025EF004F|nr:hypothetical protein [uncultured Lamprocystis sp.]